MLLHSLQWIRHKFNEVITDPSCEFMLTVCSQSHGPSTVNSRQSFQPGLPANKPVTGRLGAATLGHRRQTITLLGFLLVFPSVCPYGASPPCLGLPAAESPLSRGFPTPCDAFPPPRSCHIRDAGSPDGIWGASGHVGEMAPAWATGKRWGGTGWKRSSPSASSCTVLGCRARMTCAWGGRFTGQGGLKRLTAWKASPSGRDMYPKAGTWEGDVPGKETSLGR